MGLDWNPGQRAKPGHEREIDEFLLAMEENKWMALSDPQMERYFTITESPFETLGAPTVGVDTEANDWARSKYNPERHGSLEDFMAQMQGFRVTSLCKPCDGLSRYTNGYPGGDVEEYSFRAKFLESSAEIIGDQLLESAWISKRTLPMSEYGQELLEAGKIFAAQNHINLEIVHLNDDSDSIEFKIDVVIAAAKWCKYWSAKGHFLEAYY